MTEATAVAEVSSVKGAEASFYNQYTAELGELFAALGRQGEWQDTLEELLPYTQAAWVGQDHGNSTEKDQFTADQETAAKEVLARMGLSEQILPAGGVYEQVVIVGGMMRVNRERAQFTKQLLDEGNVETENIVFWAGQRLRDKRDDAQIRQMDLLALASDCWVSDELSLPTAPGWGSGFATEAELARLAYLENFRGARLISTQLDLQTTSAAMPVHDIASYSFAAEGYPEFTLMNCAAVERPNGQPRHTTRSCTAEWLEQTELSDGARVLVVAGNPHSLRTLRDIEQEVHLHGRPDLDLEVCGPAANPKASVQLYLGEVGRLLFMDAQAASAVNHS